MNRRGFLKNGALGTLGLGWGFEWSGMRLQDIVIGHGEFRYKVDLNWGALNSAFYPVQDCHEMVQDSKGRIILLTNHTSNNVLIYDQSGKLLDSWGTDFPGAHGLTICDEGGEDFLYIADNDRHQVIKTTIEGRVVMTIEYPVETDKYAKKLEYIPTETAVAENGDIYVADGYGQQYI
ncbi:MAG: 6-bladed beta-propeller, partial [Bacteroidota bacterium]